MERWTVNLVGPFKVGIGVIALIVTYGTPLFWLALYLVVAEEIKLWVKFR